VFFEKEKIMKKISIFFIVIFIVALALTACSSDSADEAPEEPKPTAVANVPDQPKDAEPEGEAPAEEQPEAPPEVKVDTSRGLFDTAAMIESLDAYVLRPEDMPNQYKIIVDGEQHMNNLKVINSVGEVEGKRYIAGTGRMDGWTLELQRVNKEELIPYTIFTQVEVFETSEGAEAAFGQDWLPVYQENEDETKDPHWVEGGCDLGDACLMYYYERIDPATEVTILQYEVVFIDRNVVSTVMGRGADYDMNPKYVGDVAQILFDKVDAAPQSE
jgi:hypothetical protein